MHEGDEPDSLVDLLDSEPLSYVSERSNPLTVSQAASPPVLHGEATGKHKTVQFVERESVATQLPAYRASSSMIRQNEP